MKFYDREFAEKWFSWIEWVTLTAAIWAIGENGKSLIVLCVAYLSAIIVMANAWASFDRFVDNKFPKPSVLPKAIMHILSMIVSIFPLLVMYFVGITIQSFLKSG